MNLLDRIRRSFSPQASTLAPVPVPKAPKTQQTVPGYRTQVNARSSVIPRSDRQLANTNRVSAARNSTDTRKVIRELVKSNPDLSSAVSFLLRTGIPEQFTLVGRDLDGKINVQATELAHELVRRMTYLGNPDGSYATQLDLQSLSEQLALELVLDGAACLELALDASRVPASLVPVSVTTLFQYDEKKGYKLVQRIGGVEINLDIPTIVYVTVDQLQTEPYASSYIEAAIPPVLADLDFNNDVRRALKRAVLPRLHGVIDSNMVRKLTPPDILNDSDKFAAYQNSLIEEVEKTINEADPEDAFISYDSVNYKFVEGGHDPAAIIERVQKVLNGKLSAGAKTLPTILGHGSNSNASSTEAMLYVKQANMLRTKLNAIYSKTFTTAVRLLGQDCYVEFEYEAIDLRPRSELEAYKAMEQSRILGLLSVGMLTDEEACIRLTRNLPPAGYKPLSGTMFLNSSAASIITNPSSNTSAMSQTLTPTTPAQPKTSKA